MNEIQIIQSKISPDFMFQLTKEEFDKLRNDLIFLNGISSWRFSLLQLDNISLALASCKVKSRGKSHDAGWALYKMMASEKVPNTSRITAKCWMRLGKRKKCSRHIK